MVTTIATESRVNTGARVREIALPAAARELSSLSRIDYEDAFMVDGSPPPVLSCERWARALGLKVGSPRSSRRVLGWEIRRQEFDCVLLGAGSRLGLSGELLLQREPEVLFATFERLQNPGARAVWGRIEARHRAVVRSLLGHAARRCDRMQP